MPQKPILPFVILFVGFAWYAVLAWLQRRANQQKPAAKPEEQVPVMNLIGALGLLVAVAVAAFFAYRLW